MWSIFRKSIFCIAASVIFCGTASAYNEPHECGEEETPTPLPTATPYHPPTKTPTPYYTPTSVPTMTATVAPTKTVFIPTIAPTSTPTEIPTQEPTSTPTKTPTQEPTSTPYFTPTVPKTPCVIHVSRRGSHATSRWSKQKSPFTNVTFPNTVTMTVGGASVGVWNMDPCNRNYSNLNKCASWLLDPPSTVQYGGHTYHIIVNGAIGGECKLTIGQLVSPLVIDFSGKGVEFTRYPVTRFNYGKGPEATYWIENGDDVGFLAIDKNGNGRVDGIDELFGNKTDTGGKGRYDNGFEALRAHDADGNGWIEKRDPAFSKLRIWFDRNGNGKTDKGELQRLSAAGIKAIDLNYENIVEFADRNGNMSRERSKVLLKVEGAALGIYDVWFARAKP